MPANIILLYIEHNIYSEFACSCFLSFLLLLDINYVQSTYYTVSHKKHHILFLTITTLLFFVYLHLQQKRTESHLQLSNLQCCHFGIVILRVAIISNVQNVRLQRRHRPTDDTRRWYGSQQTGSAINGTLITSLATLSLSNK